MKTLTFKFALLLILISFGFSLTGLSQSKKEANFTVSSGDLLDVSLKQGNINIVAGSGNEVKVIAKNIDEDELNLLTMEQKSGKVEIKFKGEDSDNFKLECTIPEAMNLDLSTGGGNVSIKGDLKGSIDASTAGGNIATGTVNGKTKISTGGGNVSVGDINGDADLTSAGGEMKAGSITGETKISTAGGSISIGSVSNSAEISTAGGNIQVGDIGGKVEVSTAGGNIKVGNVTGSAEISTAGGNIKLESANGEVEASTAAGNVNLKNIKGSVDANTAAGNIYAEIYPEGNVKSELNTAVGNITLKVPENTKATIVATFAVLVWSGDESDLDNIKSDFTPKEIKRSKEKKQIKVVYELNGGGPTIELNVAMGQIEIRKLK
ncbi:MAG: FapA family protein [Ignavibacteriaceae bacterium]|jgi:hypothetical protein|nr:FapA family protein [Ignavibacteriaceae bacterium]MCW8813715.1 FapA family protein [Chlorobium sp.]MCW8817479.1 FapA family protein [Ignavibacteriaceae bacterium]MCW8822727.1 FapA family protein [Ignavibacteriaceae bacterium]MCW8961858.1 FapA family protein [Ignavibacteriaceae bacterium]